MTRLVRGAICTVLVFLSGSLAASLGKPRIIGGERATENQFPYLASLRVDGKWSFHICTATILSDRFLLTAAHCCMPRPEGYRVTIGANHIGDPGESYTIKQFIKHPKFVVFPYNPMVFDIALIELVKPLQLSKNISSIGINREFFEGNVDGIVAGWGNEVDYDGLKYAKMTAITYFECQKRMPTEHFNNTLAFCALAQDVGLCWNDVGDPFVSNNQLVGIATLTRSCDWTFRPDGFIRISHFANWIDEVINK